MFSAVSIIRKALEEIEIQNIANFQQQIRVNPLAAKEFVDILPRVVQLLGQPSNAAALSCKFCLDEFSDVRFFFHWVCLSGEPCAVGKQKGGIVFSLLIS